MQESSHAADSATERLIREVADSLVISRAHLIPVSVRQLNHDQYLAVQKSMIEKECYVNSLKAAIELNAETVVIGAVFMHMFGIPIEHSWIKSSEGAYFDPTFQVFDSCSDIEHDCSYFKLYEIPVTEYLERAEAIRGRPDIAVDFLSLRMSPLTKHLFQTKRAA